MHRLTFTFMTEIFYSYHANSIPEPANQEEPFSLKYSKIGLLTRCCATHRQHVNLVLNTTSGTDEPLLSFTLFYLLL